MSSTLAAAAAPTAQFVGFRKIEPKEEQLESDGGSNEGDLNETDGAQLQQQQQHNETPDEAIEHDDSSNNNNNNDDDEMPIEGSFIRTLNCVLVVYCCYHFLYLLAAVSKGKYVQCNQCERWVHRKNYARHLRAHNNERPFVCDVADCTQACHTHGNLQQHKRSVHEGLRPYKCDQCDYSCARKETLRRHQQTVHEQQKPHACQHCTYTTAQLSNLRKHYKRKHKGHPLPAQVKR